MFQVPDLVSNNFMFLVEEYHENQYYRMAVDHVQVGVSNLCHQFNLALLLAFKLIHFMTNCTYFLDIAVTDGKI